MESIDENFSTASIAVSQTSQDNLRLTARWGNFISIVGFIGVGLMVLAAIFVLTMGNTFSGRMMRTSGFPLEAVGIIYLIMAVIYFFPVYYLYKFAGKMKESLNSKNVLTFEEATKYLKSHYQFIGICMIVVISLYVLAIIGGILSSGLMR